MWRPEISTMSHRSFNPGTAVLLAILSGLSFRTAYAQGTTVAQSGSAVAADFGSGDATLNGSGNAILFRNACRTLTVNGSGNTVQIELKSAGTITLNGTDNLVSYAPVGGTQEATIADHGQSNTEHLGALSDGSTTIAGGARAKGNNGGLWRTGAKPYP
jgi:hypothetical protein